MTNKKLKHYKIIYRDYYGEYDYEIVDATSETEALELFKEQSLCFSSITILEVKKVKNE